MNVCKIGSYARLVPVDLDSEGASGLSPVEAETLSTDTLVGLPAPMQLAVLLPAFSSPSSNSADRPGHFVVGACPVAAQADMPALETGSEQGAACLRLPSVPGGLEFQRITGKVCSVTMHHKATKASHLLVSKCVL